MFGINRCRVLVTDVCQPTTRVARRRQRRLGARTASPDRRRQGVSFQSPLTAITRRTEQPESPERIARHTPSWSHAAYAGQCERVALTDHHTLATAYRWSPATTGRPMSPPNKPWPRCAGCDPVAIAEASHMVSKCAAPRRTPRHKSSNLSRPAWTRPAGYLRHRRGVVHRRLPPHRTAIATVAWL